MEMDWKQHLQEENSSFDVLGEFQSKEAHMMAEQQHQLDDLSPLEHLQTSGYCSAAESDIESLLLDHALESVTLHPSTADMQHCLSVEENSEIDLDWFSEFDKPEQERKSPQQQLVNGTTSDQTLSNEQKNQEEPQAKPLPRLSAGVPCRARSKRRWRVRFPVPASTQQAPDSCSATITETQMQYALKMMSNIQKKRKSNHKSGNNSRRLSTAGRRRCSHCWTQKTPQWRMGPLGPKTLCNACGVRFMSGRLFPEYRPAKSPTFVSLLHSNCHRRVLQLRAGLLPFRIIPIPAPSFPSQSQLPHLS